MGPIRNKWPFKGFHVKGIPQCLTSRLARFPSHSAHVKPPLPLLARSALDHVLHQPVSTSDLLANFLFHPFMFSCSKWTVINIGTRTTRDINGKQGFSPLTEPEAGMWCRWKRSEPSAGPLNFWLAQPPADYIRLHRRTQVQQVTQTAKRKTF